ncbi:MAG: hypothetical protein JJ900_13380 [Rhodospirillales bacterium]|nr:hypothetical protein [Rhodospirillales bacterium]MBO6787837.1 hypothetical protein [Rhodospirillales bacterium]
MRAEPDATLTSIEILPVKCPQCGEAQNTLDEGTDPLSRDAAVGCMVCNYVFSADEYRRLLAERQREFEGLHIGDL